MWFCTSVGAHIDMQSIKEVPTTTAAISVYQQFSNKGNLQNCSPVYFQVFLWLRHQSAMVHTPSRIDLANGKCFHKKLSSFSENKIGFQSMQCKIQNKKRRIFWLSNTFELMTAFTSSSVIRIFCYIWMSNSIPNLKFFDSIASLVYCLQHFIFFPHHFKVTQATRGQEINLWVR